MLDSQRSLYDTEDQLVQSEIAVTTNAIALFKALGGGWEAAKAGSAEEAAAPKS